MFTCYIFFKSTTMHVVSIFSNHHPLIKNVQLHNTYVVQLMYVIYFKNFTYDEAIMVAEWWWQPTINSAMKRKRKSIYKDLIIIISIRVIKTTILSWFPIKLFYFVSYFFCFARIWLVIKKLGNFYTFDSFVLVF